MKKILVICGPTASGKTVLAVKLAKKFKGELISADSRQIYQGMDIGTGKDHPFGIKIHLIDVVKPNQNFNVADYYHRAWQVIKKAWRRNKLPILVGGTGFYIKAVIDGIKTLGIPRNHKLRVKLKSWAKEDLFIYLKKLDQKKSASLNWSDKNNPYRLTRAIEVAMFKKSHPLWHSAAQPKLNTLFIGLKLPFKILYQKIDKRVEQRLKKGLIKELKELLKKGYPWDNSALGDTIAYQEWQPFFAGKKNKKAVIRAWQFAEHDYSRRQMTWFKKDSRINWFDIRQKEWQTKVESLIKGWYYQN